MKNKYLHIFFLSALVVGLSTACKKDKPEVNEEELITTVELKFTEVGTTNVSTFKFRDPDGEGGAPPVQFDNIILAPNKAYDMVITLKDESKTPAVDITEEVREEAADHQFYFVPSAVNVTVSNLNTDAAGLPLGLSSRWTTTAASTGLVKVVLKHKPGLKAAGDPISKGDTDIELDFVTKVQ
jgi:hypothetical protein